MSGSRREAEARADAERAVARRDKEIAALRAEVERLREAIRPYAEPMSETHEVWARENHCECVCHVLRRALSSEVKP